MGKRIGQGPVRVGPAREGGSVILGGRRRRRRRRKSGTIMTGDSFLYVLTTLSINNTEYGGSFLFLFKLI
jgi:hypothetical protein